MVEVKSFRKLGVQISRDREISLSPWPHSWTPTNQMAFVTFVQGQTQMTTV